MGRYGKRREFTWQGWPGCSAELCCPYPSCLGLWPTELPWTPGICLSSSLRVQCHDEVTHPYNVSVCMSYSCMWYVQLFAVIAYLHRGLGCSVGLEWSHCINKVYLLEITHFTLLSTEVAAFNMPWLVSYLFSKCCPMHAQNNRRAAP